jgi:hypothetical protein
MKLTDQEMKEAKHLSGERCTGAARDSFDPSCKKCNEFLEAITVALSSDKLLARVRAEAKRDVFLEEVTYWFGEHRAYLESGMMWNRS